MMKRNFFAGAALLFIGSLICTSVAFAGNGNSKPPVGGGGGAAPPGPVKCTWADSRDSPHPVISGVATTLKAAVESTSTAITYQWSFGDDTTDSALLSAADPYAIEIAHTYTGKTNDKFTATLTVYDNGVLLGTDTYAIQLVDDTPAIRKAIAIENGLWFIHTQFNRITEAPEYGGGPTATIYRDWPEGAIMSTQAFIEAGFLATGDTANPYTDNVQRMVNFVTSWLGIMPLADKDGGVDLAAENRLAGPVDMRDGLGVYFAADWETEFGFGPALRLIATAGYDDTARPVNYDNTINFSDRVPGAAVADIRAWTYHQIAQQMIDFIAWAQLVEFSNDYSQRECLGVQATVCAQFDNTTVPPTCLRYYETCDVAWTTGPYKKLNDPVNYPVQSYNRGGWPFWIEGWGRKLPGGDHNRRADGTFGDASVTNWTLSGLIAAEASLDLAYPDYIKTEVLSFLSAPENLGSAGEIKQGAAKNIKDVGRAGMGLTMMKWLGKDVNDPAVQAQRNFISNIWSNHNYSNGQDYDVVDLNCADNPITPGDINCYTHFGFDWEEVGHWEYVTQPDGSSVREFIVDYTYDALSLLSFKNVTLGLSAFPFVGATPDPSVDVTYQERYLQLLLDNQKENGSWADRNWGWNNPMGTAWSIETLLNL